MRACAVRRGAHTHRSIVVTITTPDFCASTLTPAKPPPAGDTDVGGVMLAHAPVAMVYFHTCPFVIPLGPTWSEYVKYTTRAERSRAPRYGIRPEGAPGTGVHVAPLLLDTYRLCDVVLAPTKMMEGVFPA